MFAIYATQAAPDDPLSALVPAGLSSFDASLVCAPVGGRDFPITCSEFVIFHIYFPFM